MKSWGSYQTVSSLPKCNNTSIEERPIDTLLTIRVQGSDTKWIRCKEKKNDYSVHTRVFVTVPNNVE